MNKQQNDDAAYEGQDPESKAAVKKQVDEAKAASKAALAKAAKTPKTSTIPQSKSDTAVAKAKAPKTVAPTEPETATSTEPEALPVKTDATPARGKSFVYITLRDRDTILSADSKASKAVKAIVESGVEVRRNNGKERPASIPQILPAYYTRWALRIEVTAAQVATLGEYAQGDLAPEPSAVKSKTVTATTVVEDEQLSAAKALVAKVDHMAAPEAVKVAATDEFQAAIELVGSRSRMLAN